MRRLSLLALLPLLSSAAWGQQVVLNFDDLTGFAPMPAGYGGIADWGSWAASDLVDPTYPAFTPPTKILSVGLQQSILFGQDLIFDGARVVTALDFSFELFYQGALVHTSDIIAPNTGGPAEWLPSGYAGLVDELRYVSAVNVHGVDEFTYTIPMSDLGVNYCGPAVPNTTGLPGIMDASGSAVASDNNLTLIETQLPDGQFTYFLGGRVQGFVPNPSGSIGNLCVVGPVARFNRAGELGQIVGGQYSVQIDLTDVPEPPAFGVTILAGETWNFQGWYRDFTPAGPTSNFTDGYSILFQ